jgi:hypothetical protein
MAQTAEQRKQYEEYCKTNDCSAYDSNNPPPQPDANSVEIPMNSAEMNVLPVCTGAKFVMLENNKVTKYNDGRLDWYNTCLAVGAVPNSNLCIIANSWFLFESGINMALFLLDYGFETVATGLNKNQILGVNAVRCAASSGLINGADLLAALFIAAKQFGMENLPQQYIIDELYPYYCTCQQDVRSIKNIMKLAASFGAEVKPMEFPPCQST